MGAAAAKKALVELVGQLHVAGMKADACCRDGSHGSPLRQVDESLRDRGPIQSIEGTHLTGGGENQRQAPLVGDVVQVARQHEHLLVGQDIRVAVTQIGQQQGPLVVEPDELVTGPWLGAALEAEVGQIELTKRQVISQ